MTEQSPDTAQFFLTASSPCPYLEGREERKLFTYLAGRRAPALHHLLSDYGFRRSQNLIYRPACDGCQACQSVRVIAHEFQPGRRFRRILNRNRDITATAATAFASQEQYELFTRYLDARHEGGGMTQMDYSEYEYMVEDTPVPSLMVEYRTPDDVLVGAALTDQMQDGLSMVYSFFEPDLKTRSLGNYMILEHIERACAMDMAFVYMGYWVKESPKMAYKVDFQPIEVQTGNFGWRPWVASAL